MVRIEVKKLSPNAILPSYGSDGAAGMDLYACLDHSLLISVGRRMLVPTKIAVAIPRGYEGQVRPRSGLAWKHGLTVLNTPGTIDSDYRGEIMVMIENRGDKPYMIAGGDRIAQLVIAPCPTASIEEVEVLDATPRGAGGFGSTGK